MRVRASNIVAGCAALLMLTSVLLYTRTTCRFHPPINQLSDLNSLLTVLHDWELHTDNQADAKTVARIAAQLTTAMEAQQAATHAPPPATSNALTSATYRGQGEPDLLHALAVAGTRCNVAWNTEYWGDPLVWGSTHHTDTAAGCCAACHAHQLAVARGGLDKGLNSTACNTWVHCGDKERCGDMYRQCWLKHQASLPPAERPGGGSSMWTSGVVYPDLGPQADAWLQATVAGSTSSSASSAASSSSSSRYADRNALTLHFPLGDVAVQLLPELAPASVRELKRMVQLLELGGGACDGCRLYRVETNFLVQGVIRHPGAYVSTPRHPNPPQKKLMERGLACWAGGMGGPDFFVNLIDQSGFGDDHLCWGKVSDMSLLDAIVQRPIKPKAKPNDMTFLAEELPFNMTLA